MSVSPAIQGSCGGKLADAWMAFISAMSIGFSVFQTSGAKATSTTIAANATANTASEPSHSRHRTGSSAGQRPRGQSRPPPPGEHAAVLRHAPQAPPQPALAQRRQRARHGHHRERADDRRRARSGATPRLAAIQASQPTSSTPSTLARPSPAPGSRPSTSAASGAAASPAASTSAKKPSASSIPERCSLALAPEGLV